MKYQIKKIVNNLQKPGENLSQSVIKSGFWVSLFRIVNRFFILIKFIILARLLEPSDFGLMGIASMILLGLEAFSETGFQSALIQKRGDIRQYLDSAWTILILRSFCLFFLFYLVAPYASIFFNSPEATPIIQVIGLTTVFEAFTNIGIIYFQKELEFNKQIIYQFSAIFSDFIVSIISALILKNVWALVLGTIAGNLVGMITSYMIHPYRPRLSSDLEKAKELFGFGKWILGSSMILFLIKQVGNIFVGKFLGLMSLGFYQLAYRISSTPFSQITQIVSQIILPAYSKLQDDIPKLRKAFLETLQFNILLTTPIAGLIYALGPEFITLFLGEKWTPMISVLEILALGELILSTGGVMGPLWVSVGKVRFAMGFQTIKLLLLLILTYPFIIRWGILGAAYAVVASSVIPILLGLYEISEILECRIWNIIHQIAFPILSTGIMITVIEGIKIILSVQIGFPLFFLLVVIGIIVYSIILYICEIFFNCGIANIYKRFIQTYKIIK